MGQFNFRRWAVSMALAGWFSTSLSASIIPISLPADPSDGLVASDNATPPVTTGTNLPVGLSPTGAFGRAAVFPFKLPEANWESITSVTFQVYLANIRSSPTGNIDVYGLNRISSSPSLLSTDYDAPATLLCDDLITKTTLRPAPVSFSNPALLTFLNNIYTLNPVAGDTYTFLRLTYDGPLFSPSTSISYSISSSEANGDKVPTLTLVVSAPEPASFCLTLILAPFWLLRWQR